MNLFCIPYAGGSRVFESWKIPLMPEVVVKPAIIPGRGAQFGAPPLNNMDDLVAELEKQCLALGSQNLSILGHSFGAVVAYALALRLEKQGFSPTRLFVGGARAPFLPLNRPDFHTMDDDSLINELTVLNGTSSEILTNPDLMEIFLPILRADFQILETYSANRESVKCPMTIYGGSSDPFVNEHDLGLWRELTESTANLHIYEGGHFILEAQKDQLLRDIKAAIARDAFEVRRLVMGN